MKLSFCITCKGRLSHLRKTLPLNLELCALFPGEVEVLLLDYQSPDALRRWVRPYLSGQFRVYTSDNAKYFHMAHAKNVIHKKAKGDWLCNLDADNFLTLRFLETVLSFEKEEISFGRDGCSGRICLRRDLFYSLGGYDEEFLGWGMDDKDLLFRAVHGFQAFPVDISNLAPFIEHGEEGRVEYYEFKDPEFSWEANRKRHFLRDGYIANRGVEWGVMELNCLSV